MKKNITLLTLVLLTIFSKAQTSIAQDTININTVWSDTVYLDTNVYIQNGVKLTITAGTKVIANGDYKIEVQGSLQAIGTEQDSILFTVNDTTGFADIAVTYGGWGGIELLNTDENNDSTIFKYCIMQYGKANGVNSDEKIGGILNINNFNKITISNSLIIYNTASIEGSALAIKNSSPKILKNKFKYNYAFEKAVISIIDKSNAIISNNTFINNIAGVREYEQFYGYWYYTGLSVLKISHTINDNSKVTIINNKFFNNKGSSLISDNSFHTFFVNNIVANNTGSILFNAISISESKYINNTFINNDNHDHSTLIYLSPFNLFYNNVVVGYTDDSHFSQPLLKINNQTVPSLMDDIKYNYFQYGNDYLAGEGNIVGGDPSLMFIDPSTFVGFDEDAETYDYALQNSAVCVNAGILDTTGLNLPEYDIAGLARIFGGRIDIGAHENKTMIYDNINKQITNNNISIYPNPVHDYVVIMNDELQILNKKVEILDITGKVVKKFTTDNQSLGKQGKIQLEDLQSGIYFIKIGNKTTKFIKE